MGMRRTDEKRTSTAMNSLSSARTLLKNSLVESNKVSWRDVSQERVRSIRFSLDEWKCRRRGDGLTLSAVPWSIRSCRQAVSCGTGRPDCRRTGSSGGQSLYSCMSSSPCKTRNIGEHPSSIEQQHLTGRTGARLRGRTSVIKSCRAPRDSFCIQRGSFAYASPIALSRESA